MVTSVFTLEAKLVHVRIIGFVLVRYEQGSAVIFSDHDR